MIDDATADQGLRAPPSNHFEKLRGNLAGFYSIRVNRQWRLVFRWDETRYRARPVTGAGRGRSVVSERGGGRRGGEGARRFLTKPRMAILTKPPQPALLTSHRGGQGKELSHKD